MRWELIYYYYTKMNTEQPVKFYSDEEIKAYAKTKPASWFLLTDKGERLIEKWEYLNILKTGIDEVTENRRAAKKLRFMKGKNY